ncbi:hypothetical protein J1N35_006137 [Gossypium stocksii]|uniref:Reverse transcriptase zinc-binding domain-containing protein n=1 Tax=Gossypium stocksii TaxID=47602 RepID=A0A9D3WFY4_9ROSI|nr:hypothetical protein J1N35_006137 [Gossypium stocksii]
MWSKLILAKYSTSVQQWRFSANKLKEMSTVWRGIVENSLNVRVARWMKDKDFVWKIGNGKSTLFWVDIWCAIDRVPTKDFLAKRGVNLQSILNVCPWCNLELKRVDHVILLLVSGGGFLISGTLARNWNEMVFKRKVLLMDTLIFHSKMKALLGVRSAFDECMVQKRLWWFCPYKCSYSNFVS